LRYYVCEVWWTKKVNGKIVKGNSELIRVIARNKNEAVKKAKREYWSYRKRKRVPRNIKTHVKIIESGRW